MVYNSVKNQVRIILRKKVKGAIFLTIGSYLFFVNFLLSILFNRVIEPCIPTPDGVSCYPLDPVTYFRIWLIQYGWYTILIALGGLVLIIYGSHYYLKRKKDN